MSVSNLDSSIMNIEGAIEGHKVKDMFSPKIGPVTPNNDGPDMRKISYNTDKDGLMNIAAMQQLVL